MMPSTPTKKQTKPDYSISQSLTPIGRNRSESDVVYPVIEATTTNDNYIDEIFTSTTQKR